MDQASTGLRSAWVTVDGLRIHARISDDAPPGARAIVLLHGLLVSSRYMMPTAALLAPLYRVYAPDLPGYGKSAKPPRTLTVAGYARFLERWMTAMGLPRAVLLANSFGCQIIADLALRSPARADRLVLVGPTIDPTAHTLARQTARLLLDGFREPPRYVPVLLRDTLDLGLWPAAQLARIALQDHIETKLPQIRTPTLVVRGQRDPLVPQAWAEAATRLLPDARLRVVPRAGHVVNYNAPEALFALVRWFLESP